MDTLKLTEQLELHPYGALTIDALHIRQWGQQITLTCTYDPGEPGKPAQFDLIFNDCRDLRWRVYSHNLGTTQGDSPAPTPVVNLTLGTGGHRKPANILTDSFGLSVLYGEYIVERA